MLAPHYVGGGTVVLDADSSDGHTSFATAVAATAAAAVVAASAILAVKSSGLGHRYKVPSR